MSNNVIINNTEILVEILRAVSEIHDSIAELKTSTEQLEKDIAEIKKKLNTDKYTGKLEEAEVLSKDTESGECCYDF